MMVIKTVSGLVSLMGQHLASSKGKVKVLLLDLMRV